MYSFATIQAYLTEWYGSAAKIPTAWSLLTPADASAAIDLLSDAGTVDVIEWTLPQGTKVTLAKGPVSLASMTLDAVRTA